MNPRINVNSTGFIASFIVWIICVVIATSLTIYQVRDQRSPSLVGLTSLRTRVLQTAEIGALPESVLQIAAPVTIVQSVSATDVSVTERVVANTECVVKAGAGRPGAFLESINRLGTAQWSSSVSRDTIVVHADEDPASVVNSLVVFVGGTSNVVRTPLNTPVFDDSSGAILAQQSSQTPMYSFRGNEDLGFNFNGETLGVWAPHIVCSQTQYIRHNSRSESFIKRQTFTGTANATVTLLQLAPIVIGTALQSAPGTILLSTAHVELCISGLLQTSATNRASMCVQTMWQGDISRTAFGNVTLGRTTIAYNLVEPANLVAIVAGAATAGGTTRGVRVTLISTAATRLTYSAQIRITYPVPIDDQQLGVRIIPEFI